MYEYTTLLSLKHKLSNPLSTFLPLAEKPPTIHTVVKPTPPYFPPSSDHATPQTNTSAPDDEKIGVRGQHHPSGFGLVGRKSGYCVNESLPIPNMCNDAARNMSFFFFSRWMMMIQGHHRLRRTPSRRTVKSHHVISPIDPSSHVFFGCHIVDLKLSARCYATDFFWGWGEGKRKYSWKQQGSLSLSMAQNGSTCQTCFHAGHAWRVALSKVFFFRRIAPLFLKTFGRSFISSYWRASWSKVSTLRWLAFLWLL